MNTPINIATVMRKLHIWTVQLSLLLRLGTINQWSNQGDSDVNTAHTLHKKDNSKMRKVQDKLSDLQLLLVHI